MAVSINMGKLSIPISGTGCTSYGTWSSSNTPSIGTFFYCNLYTSSNFHLGSFFPVASCTSMCSMSGPFNGGQPNTLIEAANTAVSITASNQFRVSSVGPIQITDVTNSVFTAALGQTLVAGQALSFSQLPGSTTSFTLSVCATITNIDALAARGMFVCGTPSLNTFQIGILPDCTPAVCTVSNFVLGNGGLFVQPSCTVTSVPTLGTVTASLYNSASSCPPGF